MTKRFAALAAIAAFAAGAQPARAAVPDLETTSATELKQLLDAGQLTSVELTKAYIDRIAAVNRRGPALNAVRSLNPDALKEARVSDIARRTNSVRGPLEGLPILLKDNIDVAGMPTTASSIVLEHSVPDKDAFVVKRLKAAGAVILGKVNLTEFAAWVSNNQSSGNGSLHGQVLNPYDTSTDPGGSSSGSGVAAAAGLAALTIGSDTEGSILSPASQNGVVGIRPTTGLWSRAGVVPISESQDTLGPLAQTVSDAGLLLNALTAVDPEDPHTADTAQVAGTDYLAGLKPNALQGARIAVSNSTNAQYVAARNALQAAGATLVQITIPNFATAQSLQTREFRRDLNHYLGRLPADAPIKSYDEAWAYFHNHPEEGLKYGDSRFGPPSQYHLENPDELAEYEGVKAFEINRARTYLDGLLNNVDAVLQMTLGLISPAAFAGYPIVSVPGGFPADTGRPVNITFVGRRFSEAKLLSYAYAYEQATKLRRPASEVNPASWRCVPGRAFDPQGCGPFAGFAGPLSDALITPALDLEHLDIGDIKRRFAAGTLTSTQLVKAYIDRIHFVNNQGPGINAVRALNPSALAEAAAPKPGPLSGIPVLVSDTIDVAGLPTTGGSLALKDVVPTKDAALVTRLKAAGAIILGKVNVTELNGMVANGMPAGYGSLHGQVLNPYDVRTSTNGSSAGAVAAAVSALAAATVGVDTDAVTNGTNNATNSASISALAPAAATGAAALRPTFGLVSRTGILPTARSQDTPAPIGRSVADVAAVLSGLVGRDAADATTANAPETAPDYAAGLTKSALAGKRIGVIAPTTGASLTPFTDAVAELQSLGATIVPLTAPNRPTTAKIVDREFKRDLDAYLAPYGKSLADVIAFNSAHARDTLKFGQARLTAAAAIDLANATTAAAYNADLTTGRTASRAYIDTLLANAGAPVDAILSLTATFAEVGARAGYPQLTIPAGYDPTARRPQAISFTGTAGDDAKLLGFGYAFERAALVRKTPSEVMPQTWHCVAPIVYQPRACAPGELSEPEAPPTQVTSPVGGSVPATLSLILGAPATFGAFTPGVAREYTAATTATITSSAGDALLTVSDPGHLMNGAFSLPQPLRVEMSPQTWNGPISNGLIDLTFRQAVAATDALRTGSYSKTLTFTLLTTSP